ncbi:mucin-5AC-like [Ornithodoros turicata]|uniref:mucin-5AC-like n=1 Tax=Ornithodoros turicata TaxID=34597 RepID=UPI003138F5F7
MFNYACCKYVVTRVTLYHSALVDLSRSRSVHAVEHQPCCPDPLLFSAVDCKAVHYGWCSPLLKLPSFVVGHSAPAETIAPQRAQTAPPKANLDFNVLDPVELLAADIEGKLEALVNSFVAQDKVRLAARKSKSSISSTTPTSGGSVVTAKTSASTSSAPASPSQSPDQKQKDDATKSDVAKRTPAVKTQPKEAKQEAEIKTKPGKRTEVTPVRSAVKESAGSGSLKKDLQTTESKVVAVSRKSPRTTNFGKTQQEDISKGQRCSKPTTVEKEKHVDDNATPSSTPSPTPEKASPPPQRTIFKVSPPNLISLVTGAPRTTTPSTSTTTTFSSTYVPTVSTVTSSTPSRSTTVSVKVRDSKIQNDSEKPSALPSTYPVCEPKVTSTSQSAITHQTDTPSAPSTYDNDTVPKSSVYGSETNTARQPAYDRYPTTSAVDYGKARFQNAQETTRLEQLLRQKPRNGHIVTEAKSRWESLVSPTSTVNRPGQLWINGYGSPPTNELLDVDSLLSTSPRRLNSPDLYLDTVSPSIPHPKLTSSQKQHIRERSLSPTERGHAHVPVKPFLTKGSVAERVLLFERCPERSQEKPAVYNTWKHSVSLQNDPSIRRNDPQTSSLKRVVHSSTKSTTSIPRFYYPQGKPLTPAQEDSQLNKVAAAFASLKDGRAYRTHFGSIAKACGLPLYWKLPLFIAAGGDAKGFVTKDAFLDYWKRIISPGRDEPTWFVKVFSRGSRNYVVPDDLVPLMQDVIDTHPGLLFLKDAVEFHSRYVNTVIARIFYSVNRSWSGRITVSELRKSNFLQVLSLLEEEDDINQITEYFSYEHFYVIYCKFWELDKDHDLYIDKFDLSRHNEGAISLRIIERIFSGAISRGPIQKEGKMSYNEFVCFLMSEEDKRHPRSIEYWFRCMDLDGDGYLSMYELEYFYEEQLQRMEALGIETLPFKDCLCQMLDMIQPKVSGKISLADLKRCKMTAIFYDTFFNLEKYLDHEQRDPFATQRDHDGDGLEISDWDKFAAEEYELLVAEEGNLEAQDLMLSDYEADEDELSPNLDRLSDPYHRRPASLDDDEYDYAETDADYQY